MDRASVMPASLVLILLRLEALRYSASIIRLWGTSTWRAANPQPSKKQKQKMRYHASPV